MNTAGVRGVEGRMKFSPDSITAALRATNGNVNRAAMILKCHDRAIHARVVRHPEIWPEGVPRLRRGRPVGVPNSPTRLPYVVPAPTPVCLARERIVRGALARSKNSVRDAAEELRMTIGGLNLYLKHHPDVRPSKAP